MDVPLGPLNVLVGPNGPGKSTLLDAVRFLAGCARYDLESVVGDRGGYESLRFRVASDRPWISLDVEALASSRASVSAPDAYAFITTIGRHPDGCAPECQTTQRRRGG